MIITMSSETWESWRAGEHNVPRMFMSRLFVGKRASMPVFESVCVCVTDAKMCVCVNAWVSLCIQVCMCARKCVRVKMCIQNE